MPAPKDAVSLEEQIDRWRSYLRRRQAIHSSDVAELEDHLREQVAVLVDAGLATDEAFLVAVKRMGSLDALSREFAREHSERLWKQLVVADEDLRGATRQGLRTETFVVHIFDDPNGAPFYARNASLFVLPLLVVYFAWKRRINAAVCAVLAVAFASAALFANLYPFVRQGSTEILTALHLPIAAWLLVGIAYTGGHWSAG